MVLIMFVEGIESPVLIQLGYLGLFGPATRKIAPVEEDPTRR